MSQMVYLQAEVMEVFEGSAVVKVLNGFGEPIIHVVEENIVYPKSPTGLGIVTLVAEVKK